MNNFEYELKEKFKKSFDDISLSEKKKEEIKKEILGRKYLLINLEKINKFLNKEIEIDLRVVAAFLIIGLSTPIIYSVKGIYELPKEIKIVENNIIR